MTYEQTLVLLCIVFSLGSAAVSLRTWRIIREVVG